MDESLRVKWSINQWLSKPPISLNWAINSSNVGSKIPSHAYINQSKITWITHFPIKIRRKFQIIHVLKPLWEISRKWRDDCAGKRKKKGREWRFEKAARRLEPKRRWRACAAWLQSSPAASKWQPLPRWDNWEWAGGSARVFKWGKREPGLGRFLALFSLWNLRCNVLKTGTVIDSDKSPDHRWTGSTEVQSIFYVFSNYLYLVFILLIM